MKFIVLGRGFGLQILEFWMTSFQLNYSQRFKGETKKGEQN